MSHDALSPHGQVETNHRVWMYTTVMTNDNRPREECHYQGNRYKTKHWSHMYYPCDRLNQMWQNEWMRCDRMNEWMRCDRVNQRTHLELLVEFAAVSIQHGQIQRTKVCIKTETQSSVINYKVKKKKVVCFIFATLVYLII